MPTQRVLTMIRRPWGQSVKDAKLTKASSFGQFLVLCIDADFYKQVIFEAFGNGTLSALKVAKL